MFNKIKFNEPVKLKDMTIGGLIVRFPLQIIIASIIGVQFISAAIGG
jgi:hypothetical protein